MPEPVLSVRGLETHLYSREGTIRPVNRLSFDIRPGETLGIVGESGSGKTMTALSIMGLIPKNLGGVVGGSIVLEGEDLAKMTDTQVRRRRSTKMGMIFQDPATSLNPTMKVGPQIAETMKTHLGINDSTARTRTIELLDRVGIPSPEGRYNDYPFQFSGGMRQRVMIAIALSCDPPAPHRGRADDGARRDDSSAVAGLRPGDQRGKGHVGDVDHARPGRCRRAVRSSRGDVRRIDCRDGFRRRPFRASQAPVYIDAAQLHALDRRAHGRAANVDQGPPAQPSQSTARLPLRRAMQRAGGTMHR